MSNHEEFPELTFAAQAAAVISLGYSIDRMDSVEVHCRYRRQLAAFLLEAMQQAHQDGHYCPDYLRAMARNLHNPPPPPPTLAQAREADLSTPEGQATVSAFLANLAAETQP